MKLNAPKTLRLLVLILTVREFSQRDLWSKYRMDSTISLGQVNKVVRWLEGNAFVERRGAKYVLINPTGLLRAISLFRSMREIRAFSVSVDLPMERVWNSLPKEEVVFCLGTAMEKYGSYFRPSEVSFYAYDCRELERRLSRIREGLTKISCYEMDFLRPRGLVLDSSLLSLKDEVNTLISQRFDDATYTSQVMTTLDMFCDGKAHYTKELLADLWGVEL